MQGTMWWKLLLLTLYLAMLFILSRILEAVAYYEGRVASRLIDPVSLGVRKLKLLLDKRGVSYAGVVEKPEMTDLVETSGEVSEGEIIAVTLTSRSARVSSTNFTCGDHFYEEVEDTKDSVWVVQVIPHARRMFMQPKDWATLVEKVSHFGVRTGIFDCSLDYRLCDHKAWYSSRLVLALPRGHKAKDSVVLHSYTGSTGVPAVFDWVNKNLASRIQEINTFEELVTKWFHFGDKDDDDAETQTKLRVVLFTQMSIPAMFFSVLSVKFTGRAKFGMVNTKRGTGRGIAKKLNIGKMPRYQIITPESNYTFGSHSGEYLNSDSMALFLRSVYPEVNDMFLLSLIVINAACIFDLCIMHASILRRLGTLLWDIGKWNCLLIVLWLPVLAVLQLPYMHLLLNSVLKLLRVGSLTTAASWVRADWLWYSAVSSKLLVSTFVTFLCAVALLHWLYGTPDVNDADASSHISSSQWWNLQLDSVTSYLFRPMSSLTPTIGPPPLDLEIGMELLIERMAVPNFWLRPMISMDYIKDLPVWKYTGPNIDSDPGSDANSDIDKVDSDGECDAVSTTCGATWQQGQDKPRKPLMFVCEKCRALQNSMESRGKSQEQLDAERMESESACAKFLMDSDYKCTCQQDDCSSGASGSGGTEHNHRRSPKKDLCKDSRSRCSNHDDGSNLSPRDQSMSEYVAPPGMLANTECAICLENYRYGITLCGLPCGHTFHERCIMGWITRDNHCCPVCRWPAYRAKPCLLHQHAE